MKDAGRTWYEHLAGSLDTMGFTPTESDPCIFIKSKDMIVLYVNYCILISRIKADAGKSTMNLNEGDTS